jgi:hypothetical protein
VGFKRVFSPLAMLEEQKCFNGCSKGFEQQPFFADTFSHLDHRCLIIVYRIQMNAASIPIPDTSN